MGTAPALAQAKAGETFAAGIQRLITAKPEAGFRISRVLAVRAQTAVRDMVLYADQSSAPRDHASTIAFYGAIVDVYPLGNGLRVSAGWEGDISYSAVLLSDRGNQGETVLSESAVPSLTVGYGRTLNGPLNIAVDGGVFMRDRHKETDPASPRLVNSVSRLYPVVRLSVSRAF